MTAEVPSDSARTRVIVMVVIGVVVFFVVVGAIWYVITDQGDGRPKQARIEPAEETSATTSAPVPSAEPSSTQSESPTGPDGQTGGVPPGQTAAWRKVAFRLGDAIYVANEDGSELKSIAPSGESYALSPDGRTLAVVTKAEGAPVTITLIDIATELSRSVGRGAVPIAPSWSPDSKWLTYTAQEGETWSIKGVATDGTGDAVLIIPGALPAVSPDGRVIAFKTNEQPGQDDPLLLLTAGIAESSVVENSVGSLSWAWGPGPTLYFTKADPDTDGQWQLWAWRGGKARQLGSIGVAAPAHAVGDLVVSADGKYVAMSAIGDDDYSRLIVFSVNDRSFSRVATRRDAYPSQWSSEGRILYFEGNSYQGEPSALMSVEPDGEGRRTVVAEAQP